MANTPSAIKCIRQIATRSENNRRNRSRMRTEVKKLHKALESKDGKAARELLAPTVSALDKSVQKGILKKNTASRIKSRLTVRVNALATAEGSS